jgi:hypothetical protein
MVIIASIIILKKEVPRESHQAKGTPITSSKAVVMPANFKVSHIGERSINKNRGYCTW